MPRYTALLDNLEHSPQGTSLILKNEKPPSDASQTGGDSHETKGKAVESETTSPSILQHSHVSIDPSMPTRPTAQFSQGAVVIGCNDFHLTVTSVDDVHLLIDDLQAAVRAMAAAGYELRRNETEIRSAAETRELMQ